MSSEANTHLFIPLHSQNFYNQCFQDDTLVMIKDSTPVDRKQLDPNKVGPALVLTTQRH